MTQHTDPTLITTNDPRRAADDDSAPQDASAFLNAPATDSAATVPRQRSQVAPMGEVLRPGQAGYQQAADTLFFSGSPELIVRPRDAVEVAAAIRHATDSGMAVSVRSGGHSVAGLSTHTDGMVIDLGLIDRIEVVDPGTRRVRIGAGATWGEVAAALRPHGLGITAGDTREVGVGGLTLGGGIGWLVRKYGLAIDSLAAAELVLADGRIIRVDETQHAELLWGLRGGGGNFGVVTEFEFIARGVETVHYGTIGFALDDVPGLLRGWRDAMRVADDNLSSTVVLVPAMAGNPAMAMVLCCYADPADPADPAAAAEAAADAALAPIRALGTVTMDTVRQLPYSEALEAAPPPGMQMLMRNTFVPELTDDAVTAVAAAFDAGQSMITLRSLGGAVARVDANATAFAHRDAEVMLLAMTVVPPGTDERQKHDMEQALLGSWKSLEGFGSGAYGNFLSSATAADSALVYPAATYRRLVTVKRRYDPGNVFRRNHNVLPEVSDDGIGPEAA